MKLFLKIFLISLVAGVLFLQSCFKVESYPTEPKIEFMDFTFKDSLILGNHILAGQLRFSFVDGDGDLGFGLDSTSGKTVFLEKYKIVNRIAIRIEFDEDIISYQIPHFSTSGDRKPLKGEIIIKSLDEIPPVNPNDTIMYKFYVVDREYHYSNTDSTGYLILRDYIN